MGLTYFAAPLKCPRCGVVSPDDTSTVMNSHLVDEPGIHVLRAGDHVHQSREEIAEAFHPLHAGPHAGALVLLQDWFCAKCQETRFAHVVFQGDRIASIRPVPLSGAALDGVQLLSSAFPGIYEDLVGEPLFVDDAIRSGFEAKLRAALDKYGRSSEASRASA